MDPNSQNQIPLVVTIAGAYENKLFQIDLTKNNLTLSINILSMSGAHRSSIRLYINAKYRNHLCPSMSSAHCGRI